MKNSISKAVVFLDRDGTINEDVGYLSDPKGLVLIEGAGEAIKKLNSANIKVIVVSNQSGVGRGYYTNDDVEKVNKRLFELLSPTGAQIDGIYYCSHHPDFKCDCRKPSTGLAKQAALEHEIDGLRSYVVGDKGSDVDLAGNIGAKGILVLTGKGTDEHKNNDIAADHVAKDLREAVDWILDDLNA
ncbi:MAG: HAD family hydrolase [Deltaproteobacteria bacterium]|nr:HAD family hydrolase [Deltaproteobacteria bacterium]